MNILEVIQELNKFPNKRFKRYNDDEFIIFRGSYGDIMYELKSDSKGKSTEFTRVLPVFNYINEIWIEVT